MSYMKEETLEELVEKHTAIIEKCRKSNTLFEDPEFPANDKSIKLIAGVGDGTGYQWLRPEQINPEATFIEQGFSRSDVSQGDLGDCWILAAISGIAERRDLISRVVPEGQSISKDSYCGAFRFRMRRFGKEIEILVDDRLPTKNGEAVYTQPVNGEFWVCLLEKALAKHYGCYESLDAGHIYEALADLTGGLCEFIAISAWRSNLSELARHIDKCINTKHSVVGASSLDKVNKRKSGNGVDWDHAYTVTGLKSIQVKADSSLGAESRQQDLIRLRNPWGSNEWKGVWSDDYSGWSDEQKKAVQLVVREDGEFWMSFEDFAKFYSDVSIVHFAIPADTPEVQIPAGNHEWRSVEFYGKWKRGETSGGEPACHETHFSNPQFEVELKDSPLDEDDMATCLVSVEEPDQRHLEEKKRKFVSKAVFLYRLADGESRVDDSDARSETEVLSSGPFSSSARTLVHRFRVPPGRYAVMPSTEKPEEEGRFLLKIFKEA